MIVPAPKLLPTLLYQTDAPASALKQFVYVVYFKGKSFLFIIESLFKFVKGTSEVGIDIDR